MIFYRCNYCFRPINPEEKFYGKVYYKYTKKGDYTSKDVYHMCEECYLADLKNPRTKQKLNVKWLRLHKNVDWLEE